MGGDAKVRRKVRWLEKLMPTWGARAARGRKGRTMKETNERKGKEREKERNSSKVRSNERHAKFSCKRQPQQEQGRLKTIAE